MLVEKTLGKRHGLTCVSTLAEATEALGSASFDVLLLDVMLPDGDGFQFCARARAEGKLETTSVIFLTGKSELSEKLMGFSLGAEDYIVKPFEPLELKARVEARVRSRRTGVESARRMELENLRIDLGTQKILKKDGSSSWQEIDFTPREFSVLVYLARKPDQVYSRNSIIDAVWGPNVHVFDRTIDTHLCNIRKKLSDTEYMVESVHGVGYRLKQRKEAA